ncbi:MAG: glycerol-3-phosphate acyltransferase [Acidimicrobiia bacterium]
MILALVGGYLLGGLPTADLLARGAGVDLRSSGSGNPGANNAMRLGGRRLAAKILVTEMVKGAGIVAFGWWLRDDPGMAVAGIGAVLGNVLNPYRRFRGGQGLAIAAGVLLLAVPAAAAAGLALVSSIVVVVRQSAPATLVALIAVAAISVWLPAHPWGISDPLWSAVLAIGVTVVITPKQLLKIRERGLPPPRESA